MGKYHKGFEPFLSFLLITWTQPTLQPLNKDLLEVLLIESTHLALIIFSLELRRKITQDYQAPLADIFKRQNFTSSQVTEKKKFLSSKHSLCLLPTKNNSQENKISKFLKIFKSSNFGFFPFLLVPNILDFQKSSHFISLIVFSDIIWKFLKWRSKFDYMFLMIPNPF